MRCFAARGFSGTTTREIAAGVGITEAALYRYFPEQGGALLRDHREQDRGARR
jgi:AcrR family transcriptional regulator